MAFWLVLVCLALSLHRAEAGEQKLNVLYFIVDDYRNEMNHAYEQTDIQTPNIDKLADTGLTFDFAYCQQAVCSPRYVRLYRSINDHNATLTAGP
jgi:arylsulfatase A-like enzyme